MKNNLKRKQKKCLFKFKYNSLVMNYNVKKYDPNYDGYRFEFDDKRWINIDLEEQFPNYHIINNNYENPLWYYISQDGQNTITKCNTLDLRRISTSHKKIRIDNIVYKIATQTEYDAYNLENNDNSKLYHYLNEMWTTPRLQVTSV